MGASSRGSPVHWQPAGASGLAGVSRRRRRRACPPPSLHLGSRVARGLQLAAATLWPALSVHAWHTLSPA